MSVQMKNYMEICVERTLDKILENYDICNCDRCRADIMAIALNRLPAKYVVTPEGEKFFKLASIQNQFEVDTIAEVTKAIEIVKNNSRH